jgi:hypothetical protein
MSRLRSWRIFREILGTSAGSVPRFHVKLTPATAEVRFWAVTIRCWTAIAPRYLQVAGEQVPEPRRAGAHRRDSARRYRRVLLQHPTAPALNVTKLNASDLSFLVKVSTATPTAVATVEKIVGFRTPAQMQTARNPRKTARS